ncbi:MAG TPA: NUDIX hydrolase [Streptosporangiaceae bacterium]|nr:NUDIX hydrolase [Streptosporangiaceae bacterium]
MSGATDDVGSLGELMKPNIKDTTGSWPVASSTELGRGVFVRLRTDMVRMPDGEAVGRDVLEHPGAVAVLALDADELVLMIRQYRHPVGRLLWEIPAGLRDVAGEPLRATAERELLEEAGYRAAQWSVLTDSYSSPGISTERIRIFLARGLTLVPESERSYVPEHEEAHLEVAWVPLDEAVARILAGDLHNGVTALGILAAYAARQDGSGMLRGTDAPEH